MNNIEGMRAHVGEGLIFWWVGYFFAYAWGYILKDMHGGSRKTFDGGMLEEKNILAFFPKECFFQRRKKKPYRF